MTRHIKAVIFDVDGVLIDSREANAEFLRRLLQKGGYPEPTRAALAACFALTLPQALKQLTGTSDRAEIEHLFELGHNPALYPAELLVFPACLHTSLTQLRRHYRLAIVTSRIRAGVETVYQQADLADYFDTAVSFEDYQHPKPHPQSLQIALQRLELAPSEAIYVGDSHTDIEAATAANMPSLHLATTADRDATLGITNFNQIVKAIRQIAGDSA